MSAGHRVSRRRASSHTSGRSGASTTARNASCGCCHGFAAGRDVSRLGGADPGPAGGVPRPPGPGHGPAASTTCSASSTACSAGPSTQELLAGLAAAGPPAAGDLGAGPVPVRCLSRPAPAARRCGRAPRQPPGTQPRPGLPDDLRPVLRARTARRGGVPASPRRHRFQPAPAGRAWREIREEPPGPARAAHRRPDRRTGAAPPGRRSGQGRCSAVHLRRAQLRPSRHGQCGLPLSRGHARPGRPGRGLAAGAA